MVDGIYGIKDTYVVRKYVKKTVFGIKYTYVVCKYVTKTLLELGFRSVYTYLVGGTRHSLPLLYKRHIYCM
jgi:hypothetical protein